MTNTAVKDYRHPTLLLAQPALGVPNVTGTAKTGDLPRSLNMIIEENLEKSNCEISKPD
jgi:ferric-dicitrate binding protein FerR (iron transport regulator)